MGVCVVLALLFLLLDLISVAVDQGARHQDSKSSGLAQPSVYQQQIKMSRTSGQGSRMLLRNISTRLWEHKQGIQVREESQDRSRH